MRLIQLPPFFHTASASLSKAFKLLALITVVGFPIRFANATTNLPPDVYSEFLFGQEVSFLPSDFNSYTGIIPPSGNINDNWVLNGNARQGYTFVLTDLSPQAEKIQGLMGTFSLTTNDYAGNATDWLSGGPTNTDYIGVNGSFAGDGLPHKFSIHLPPAPYIGVQYIQGGTFSLNVSGFAPEGGAYRISIVRDVPEPKIYVMLLVGLAMIGWITKQRKSSLNNMFENLVGHFPLRA